MNERIKELLAQATKEVWGNNDYNGAPEFEGYEVDQEKFAELIIKECIDLLPDDCQSKNGCHTSWVIKEHFGVS